MATLSIKSAIEIIRSVQASDNDMVVAISGYRGVGKSTLMIQITKDLLGIDNFFTRQVLDRYMIYGRKDLENKLKRFNNCEPLCVDEAINLLFKREFQNRDQNNIIKMFNTYRNKRYLIFILIPNFWDLDSSVRNSSIIKWWVFCYKRGEAYIFQPEDNPFNRDPWNEKDNKIAWRSKIPIYSLVNYYGNIYWDELSEEEFRLYETIKAEKREASYESEKTKTVSRTELAKQILSINPLVSSQVLADTLGTTRQLINQVKKKLSDKEATNIYILPNNEDDFFENQNKR